MHSLQTTSKFPFRWWGINPTLSNRHQLNEPPGSHRAEEGTPDASESKDANPRCYADSIRSASFPSDRNKIMTRFAPGGVRYPASISCERSSSYRGSSGLLMKWVLFEIGIDSILITRLSEIYRVWFDRSLQLQCPRSK
jgi:hypothetical protein